MFYGTEATKRVVKLYHPEDPELAFLYGTILTDGNDTYQDMPTDNICVFADREVGDILLLPPSYCDTNKHTHTHTHTHTYI